MKSLERMSLVLIFLLFIPTSYAENCIDPDGGTNYYHYRCVTFYEQNYCDRCINSNILIESSCTEDQLTLTKHDCFPGSCVDPGECVAISTTTISVSSSTTIEVTSSTVGTTTSMVAQSTTTSTSTGSSMLIIQADEIYDSCSNAYDIVCNQLVRREVNVFEAYDNKDYFKFTLDEKMKVRIRLNSTNIFGPDPRNPNEMVEYYGDYDLYTKWDGACPDVSSYYCNDNKIVCCSQKTGTYDCGPCSDNMDEYNNSIESCPEEGEQTLEPGTYYFLVYNYIGDAPYDVNLICSGITNLPDQTTTTVSGFTTTILNPNGWTTSTTKTSDFFSTTTVSETSMLVLESTTTIEETIIEKGELSINNTIFIAIVIALLVLVIMFSIMKFTKSKSSGPKPKYDEETIEQPFY
jgi:hypothetical protein